MCLVIIKKCCSCSRRGRENNSSSNSRIIKLKGSLKGKCNKTSSNFKMVSRTRTYDKEEEKRKTKTSKVSKAPKLKVTSFSHYNFSAPQS